jgi:hypothetical protein
MAGAVADRGADTGAVAVRGGGTVPGGGDVSLRPQATAVSVIPIAHARTFHLMPGGRSRPVERLPAARGAEIPVA